MFQVVTSENLTYNEYRWEISSLRRNPLYVSIYTHWTRLLLTGLFPFLYLTAINIFIFIKLRTIKGQKVRIMFCRLPLVVKKRPSPAQRCLISSSLSFAFVGIGSDLDLVQVYFGSK